MQTLPRPEGKEFYSEDKIVLDCNAMQKPIQDINEIIAFFRN